MRSIASARPIWFASIIGMRSLPICDAPELRDATSSLRAADLHLEAREAARERPAWISITVSSLYPIQPADAT